MINNHFSTVFGALVALAALTAPANTAERTAVAYGIPRPGSENTAPSCWFALSATATRAYPKIQ